MLDPAAAGRLTSLISGYWVSQAVYAAAKFGLADLLKGGPRSATDLAAVSGAKPDRLFRLLRALASVGVFAETTPGVFQLTPTADLLRSDVEGSQRALALMMGEEHYEVWGRLVEVLRTDENAFEKQFGLPVFDYLAKNPEKGKIFDAAMVGIHGRETAAVLEAYDFSDLGRLVDVGGGNGSKLTGILQRYPSLRGTLYDLPHVVERARPLLQAAGVADRCELVGGNFFANVPGGGDAYLMRHIIHDWNDEQSLTILRNIHRAMPDDGRLLLVESVIPPGNGPFAAKLLDLTMMLIPGGKERTEAEYRELYAAAGFMLVRIVPTSTEISVIEGRKR
jgi:hypothetical protein